MCTFAGGYAFPRKLQGRRSGAYPFFKVSDMNAPGNERELTSAVNWVDDDDLRILRAKLAPPGTVLFPKVGAALKTEKRRVLVAPALFDNNVMGLVPGTEILSEYLLAAMENVCLAKIAQEGVVPSVNQAQVGGIKIPVPPLEEQRRIADLLGTIDTLAARTSERSRTALALKTSYLGRSLKELAHLETRALGSLANVQSGVSWTKSDEVIPGEIGGVGVMGVSNVQRDHVHADGCTWVRRTPQIERRLIAPHTILTIRTNGNADRIGNVHLAPAAAVGYTISSFLTAITPNDSADARYVLYVLQSPQVQAAITAATSGSTGLKNIAVSWIRGLEIPWPDLAQRRRIADTAVAFDSVIAAHAEAELSLHRVRESVSTSLLSGNEGIPDSYDRFLGRGIDAVGLVPVTA